jgi:sn-glycerol 3-phosphate transport system ATP-binding protein
MNFLEAHISADGHFARLPGRTRLPLAGATPEEIVGRDAILGIRPEHFDVVGTDDALLTLDVNHVEILGADTLVYGRLDGAQEELTIRLPDVHHFDTATRLGLSVAAHRLHLFDPDTGRRMAL